MNSINRKNDTYKNQIIILDLYNTIIRNIGVYTSLSFGALIYSRFYRGHNFFLDTLLILISISFTVNCLILTHNLINYIEYLKGVHENLNFIKSWMIVPYILMLVNYVLFL